MHPDYYILHQMSLSLQIPSLLPTILLPTLMTFLLLHVLFYFVNLFVCLFVLKPSEFNWNHLFDQGLATIHWNLMGSLMDTQLKTMTASPPVSSSSQKFSEVEEIPLRSSPMHGWLLVGQSCVGSSLVTTADNTPKLQVLLTFWAAVSLCSRK